MDYDHLPLFEARALKEEALERVERNANSEWKDAALKSVQHRARHCASVTANDVFADLEQLGLHTHENRALVLCSEGAEAWLDREDRSHRSFHPQDPPFR